MIGISTPCLRARSSTLGELFTPSAFPVFNLDLGGEHFYGFPTFGIPGFKLGRYDHHGEGADPDTIGRTPLLRLRRLGGESGRVEIYAKAEFQNPGVSVKDRAAAAILREAEASGRLHPGATILDATSGNTGIAYAMIAAARGYRLKA